MVAPRRSRLAPVRSVQAAEAAHPATSLGERDAGPTYVADGRTRRPSPCCSRMCALHPAVRAQVNIDVNIDGGTSAKSSTMAAQNSTFVSIARSGRRDRSSASAASSSASAAS